jgi:hypothetical protein
MDGMSQLEGDPDLLVECRYVVSTNPPYQPQLGMSAERGYVRVRQRAGYEGCMERDELAPSIRGGLELLRTREDLARHVAAAAAAQSELPAREVIDLLKHQTTDPEVVVAEFTYRWHSQEPLSVGCV